MMKEKQRYIDPEEEVVDVNVDDDELSETTYTRTGTEEADYTEGHHKLQPTHRMVWPEDTGNCFQRLVKRWTYSYMKPLLQRGYYQFRDDKCLLDEDLYQVPDDLRSQKLVASFL